MFSGLSRELPKGAPFTDKGFPGSFDLPGFQVIEHSKRYHLDLHLRHTIVFLLFFDHTVVPNKKTSVTSKII